MKIIADSNLALLDKTFAGHGEILRIPGRDIQPKHLHEADVLLVRSISRVNKGLLAGSGVRFVGSATIGTDHLDTEWLDSNGIAWASAPGCNAVAASQYTLAMILLACERLGRQPDKQSVGIIGHGNVGSRLHQLLVMMGITCVSCDPPLQESGTRGLVSMTEALAQDVVSLHVPLTRDGPCPSYQMINQNSLEAMPKGALLVNSARGDVSHGDALLDSLQKGRIHAALDVWPGEPGIETDLLDATVLASPHVAGYSVEGKQNGTMQIYDAFCRWLGTEPPVALNRSREKPIESIKDANDLAGSITRSCDVAADDSAIRQLMGLAPAEVATGFDQLRKTYRLRHDVPV